MPGPGASLLMGGGRVDDGLGGGLGGGLELGGGEAERVRLAARVTTDGATLDQLAQDGSAMVRAAVALNPVNAQAANARLAEDPDERVRSLLATKMARLLPGLSGGEQGAAQSHVHAMLRLLARDAAVRVRKAIAEALQTMTEAPRDVIVTLAQDKVCAISEPVVRFSPLLTDADLLDLLATPPYPEVARAVASRAGLSGEVADRIATHADSPALVALLTNKSATIREATLDALVGRAGDHPEWHEPLVCRPHLPLRSIRALSMMVAGHLLDGLLNRTEVAPGQVAELRALVASRLDLVAPQSEAEVMDHVLQLKATGQLSEMALHRAARSGDARLAGAMLAVGSGVPVALVDRAVALRSAKALVSLVHRAGFGMSVALEIQQTLGRLGPGERLMPATGGLCPLTPGEVDWQIELLSQPG